MSSDAAQLIATLLNGLSLSFLTTAQVSAFRDRDRRERATGERPQPFLHTARGRVLNRIALALLVVAAAFLVYGIVTG